MKKILINLLCLAVMLPIIPFQMRLTAQSPYANGNLVAAAATCVTTVGATQNCVQLPVQNAMSTVSIEVNGTFSATINFEVTGDPVNGPFYALLCVPYGTTTTVTSTTGIGLWFCTVPAASYAQARINTSNYSSGTAVIKIKGVAASAGASGPHSGGGGGSSLVFVKHTVLITGAGTYTVDGGITQNIPTSTITFNASLFTMPVKTVMIAMVMKHSVAFTGVTNETSVFASVGIATSTTVFSASTLDVATAVSDTNSLPVGGAIYPSAGTYTVTATFSSTCSSGSCAISGLSAGSVDIWVLNSTLP